MNIVGIQKIIRSQNIARLLGAFGLMLVLAMPSLVFAAPLLAAPELVHVGDTFFVDFSVTESTKKINVVEGSVSLKGVDTAEVATLSTGNSAFDLWAQVPRLNDAKNMVSFTAGVTHPITPDHALVMRLVLHAIKPGLITLTPKVTLYVADGIGTAITNGDHTPVVVRVAAADAVKAPSDAWQSSLRADTTPPAPFTVTLARHFSLFQNRIFATFETTDAESGIASYEIKEGNSGYVSAVSPYLLQHQRIPVVVTVRAVDMAGNERLAVIAPSHRVKYQYILYGFILVALIALGVCGGLWIVRRRKSH